ncbi:CYTH domain-containing protein [Paraflavitalea sp. CAU 1676]|uniref:CYTH domain-containing protein n=1 Tax=Paraflavitalea sp. CAU 1676 TaxID=3032598 RepID=UPI0023DC8BC1|nr:CYTH domain-containing protein [Paraflavitalea sp. CAU 1676]MDF2188932.1 CYTH domain-containing protein [Paraflavitalea sp. CAU 1676]
MTTEIERKFLVKPELWLTVNKGTGKQYVQGYLLTEPGKTIRVRIGGDQGFLTIKGATKGISRSEFEYEIPVADAEQLLKQFCAALVAKTRYEIEHKGKHWEVDVFAGDNEGLVVAEIELAAEDEAFELPDWVDQEVSDDERYYNAYLSARPYKTW